MGLSLADGKADLMLALLEGIALRTAEVLAAMEALHPFRGPVSIDGGLSRNGWFVQFLSEVAGHDLFLPEEAEQTAAGAARMAAAANGLELAGQRPGRLVPTTGRHRAERMERFAAARQAVEGYSGHIAGLGG